MKTTKSRTFEPTQWFEKLLEGRLFGREKDKLILQILKLGGKSKLRKLCGIRFPNEKVISPNRAPSIKKLSLILTEVKSFRREMQKRQKKAKRMMANSKNYDKKIIDSVKEKNYLYSMELWTPKEVKTGPTRLNPIA